MKIQVCVVCHNAIEAVDGDGKKVCPICSSYEFEEAEATSPTCTYCGKRWSEDSGFKKPPFYNSQTNTFYCGCRGWD